MKKLTVTFFLLLSFAANAQTGTFTDSRDGQAYTTIVIGNKKWFRENLRFETSKSFFPNYNKSGQSNSLGNFYSNEELKNLCPAGWHVSTISDWEEYVRVAMKKKGIDSSLFRYDTTRYIMKNYVLDVKGISFIRDSLLSLYPVGWVEGLKWKKRTGMSLWVVDAETNDPKYHIHGGYLGYVKHSHDHNIIDKPERVRKFPVRCVCDETRSVQKE